MINKILRKFVLILVAIGFTTNILSGKDSNASNVLTSNHIPHSPIVVNNQIQNGCSGKVSKILVEKSIKKMTLLDTTGCEVKTYAVRIGKNSGPKQCEGDSKTPEGVYKITEKRNSKYVKFLAIDYPRAKDIKKAKELGCNPGNSIGIHSWIEGLPKEGSQGCITVWNKSEILEIDKLVKVGTEVEIKE